MSGETESNVSGWTTDTLRAHLIALIAEQDRRYEQRHEANQVALRDALAAAEKAVTAALTAADRAVAKAEAASDKRFESVNEFRQTLADQTSTLTPRAEYEVRMKGLEDKVADIRKHVDQQVGRARGLGDSWGILVGAVGLAAAVIAIVVAVAR